MPDVPEKGSWFPQARFGMFIHWDPYDLLWRGEQPPFREHLSTNAPAGRLAGDCETRVR